MTPLGPQGVDQRSRNPAWPAKPGLLTPIVTVIALTAVACLHENVARPTVPPLDVTLECAPDPSSLSPIAKSIFDRIRSDTSLDNSPAPENLLLTSCNRLISVPVDGPEIFGATKATLGGAQHEVDMAFFEWEEESDAADLIGEGLRIAEATRLGPGKLLVRILVNDLQTDTERKINRLYNSAKDWQLDEQRVELQLATYPHSAFGALHDKFVVVDGRVLVVTGANPQSYHDNKPSRWHDTGYQLEGEVALSALASFDDAWNNHAEHWQCRQRTGYDCRQTQHPSPDRSWLPSIARSAGSTSIISVGRKAIGSPNNDTENPQDLAWITAFDTARNNVHVDTPNINDDAFQNAVIRTAARGVRVQILTSLGFNSGSENIPGQGGDNETIVGRLRQRMRRDHPAMAGNLQICWYSRDGVQPVFGNDAPANHTKFMSVDSQVAIVGSGNMDTQSWNHSREFNVLVDEPQVVQVMEGAFFRTDWQRASCQLVELYEGNHGTQELNCSVAVKANLSMNFQSDSQDCENDEAKSLVLYDVPVGRVIRLFDNPDGKREDDWLEIIVKRQVREKVIGTFENSFEDPDVRAIYHRNNSLDGKVSRIEIASVPSGPTVDLYEGNNGAQNLLCSVSAGQNQAVNFQNDAYGCDNDEARSLMIYDFPAGRVIRLFDEPDGEREDDWIEITVKRGVREKLIGTFESTFEDADVRTVYHRNNSLDGKVSRLEVSSTPSGPTVDLYEGNNGTQNLLCSVGAGQDQAMNFQSDAHGCDNDEARSLVMYGFPAGKTLLLFDSPSGDRDDDWIVIRSKTFILQKIIPTFEASFEDSEVSVQYFRNNGLNGKVSRLEISDSNALQGILSFYEGRNASENKVCDLVAQTGKVKFQQHSSCDNDEAKSLVLTSVPSGTIVDVYDDPDCKTDDDWTRVNVKRDLSRFTVGSFEQSISTPEVDTAYHHDNGLDGKVSCVKIVVP